MSMRKKILIPMAAVAVVCATVIGILGVYVVRLFVGGFNSEQLSTAHTVATTIIEDYVINAERAAETAADSSQLASALQACLTGEGTEQLIEQSISLMASTGVDLFTVTDREGIVLFRAHEPDQFGDSVVYQANVKHALQGQRYTSIEEGTAVRLSVRCGAPVYDPRGRLIGVLSMGYRLDQSKFVDYIKRLAHTEVTVFWGDTRIATTILNEQGERAIGTKASVEVSRQVLGGEEYIGRVPVVGRVLLASYSPLRDTEGTVLGMLFVGLDTSKMDARMVRDTWIMIGVVLLLVMLSVFVAQNVASRLSRPIVEISNGAKHLAIGDVAVELSIPSDSNTKDEVAMLADDFREMMNTIGQQADILTHVANGDYSVSIPIRSKKDIINLAIGRLIDRNNELLAEISKSAAQVSAGSKQIELGAQSLARGSAEQAGAIEALSASIGEIAGKTKQNAEIAIEASRLSSTIRERAEQGSAQMERLVQAGKEIDSACSQVERVIKMIEDIAFQTNLLALNAAVEAARAGQHGKGFAVVADEVRNLAAKSAEAAKDTGSLIERAISKANLGLTITKETSASLEEIVAGINQSTEMAAQIALLSDEQAHAVAQINVGIEQVAQVIQQNSATAEESAAAAEDMNLQSDSLSQLIAQFTLKSEDDAETCRPLCFPYQVISSA